MDIKTFADLAKLAATCRKHGIEHIKINKDGIEFRVGEKPRTRNRKESLTDIQSTQFTDEEVLLWSAGLGNEA